ncbi:MAG: molybdopterin-dependent oxidoreductase, partial [Thermoanaerobaculia bacterium]|nr:molybdopterin-dependent oxidoreductase [Thermoanaerobaculia bacterium]
MSKPGSVNRRDFLKTGAVAGGSLVISFYVPGFGRSLGAAEPSPTFTPNAFLRIAPDESVTVVINHSEMGQGVTTSLAMLVADEMDADWNRVRVEFSTVDAVYNHTVFGVMLTGGSTTTTSEWERFRKAGATARAMLVAT